MLRPCVSLATCFLLGCGRLEIELPDVDPQRAERVVLGSSFVQNRVETYRSDDELEIECEGSFWPELGILRLITLGLLWPTADSREICVSPREGGGSVISVQVLDHTQLFWVFPLITRDRELERKIAASFGWR